MHNTRACSPKQPPRPTPTRNQQRARQQQQVRALTLVARSPCLLPACARAGKVHGSLARAGKVRGQAPKVPKQDKKKKPKGRAMKRIKFNRRFVNVGESRGGEREKAGTYATPCMQRPPALPSSTSTLHVHAHSLPCWLLVRARTGVHTHTPCMRAPLTRRSSPAPDPYPRSGWLRQAGPQQAVSVGSSSSSSSIGEQPCTAASPPLDDGRGLPCAHAACRGRLQHLVQQLMQQEQRWMWSQ